MQDFDTLRHRVEETAERLLLAQSERHEETQSLIGILRHLEEKFSAQEQQFAYYRDRLEPLERSNAQLTSLIVNLLDLIDRGFGEASLDPMRKASEMASAMLQTDIKAFDHTPPDQDSNPDGEATGEATGETDGEATGEADGEADSVISHAEPEMATFDDIEMDGADDSGIEAASEVEEDVQVIQDLLELVEESPGIAGEEPVAIDDDEEDLLAGEDALADEQDEALFGGVSDLELEEVPLSYLEDDIDVAADNMGADIDAIAAMALADTTATDDDTISPVDVVSSVDVMANDEMPAEDNSGLNAPFEDVSDAVLQLELEEDATAGFDDLPEIVKTASAAFTSDDATAEADTIAALAQAMEEETSSGHAPPPAPSDIRSLMLRVEALAKKAEAMRLAQAEDQGREHAADKQEAPSARGKNPGVAA